MARRAGSGKTPRQASDAASPGSGLDRQAKNARARAAGRPGPVPAPAGRRRARPAGRGGGRRGPSAATKYAGQANGGGPVAKASSGESGGSKPGQGRRSDRGTGTVDPCRLRSRPQARGDREGVPGLAVDRAACYHRRERRAPQDGAIDGGCSSVTGGRTCPGS